VRRRLVGSLGALLLGTVVVGLLGCGGSDGGSSLTKAEFIKKANVVCLNGNEERYEAKAQKAEELHLQPGETGTAADHRELAAAALAPYAQTTERLQELVPSSQAEKLEPLIKAREEVAETVMANIGNVKVIFPAIQKANVLATRYGLDECTV
jgi:hypothetical protein